jgi:hypothetical protein
MSATLSKLGAFLFFFLLQGALCYYPKCSGPEGLPGSCKPLSACAQYYATPANYDYDHSNYYKSCNFGYGGRGACCPDVYHAGIRIKKR